MGTFDLFTILNWDGVWLQGGFINCYFYYAHFLLGKKFQNVKTPYSMSKGFFCESVATCNVVKNQNQFYPNLMTLNVYMKQKLSK